MHDDYCESVKSSRLKITMELNAKWLIKAAEIIEGVIGFQGLCT